MKIHILYYIFTCILITQTISNHSFAQHPYFYTINDDETLPSNEIYQLYQDAFGNVWIGSDVGLYKFDGISCTSYKSKYQNGRSISGLAIDSKNNVWCRTFSGQIFRTDADSLKLIVDLSKGSLNSSIFALDPKTNTVWVVNETRLEQYDMMGNRINFAKINEILPIDRIEFSEEKLYLGTYNKKTHIFDIKTKTIREYFFETNSADFTNNYFKKIGNKLYLFEHNETKNILEIYAYTNEIKRHLHTIIWHENKLRIHNICVDKQEYLWLCTSSGAFQIKEKTVHLTAEKALFKDSKISHLLHDFEEQYWLSSLQEGIFVIPKLDVMTYNRSNYPLNESNITALFADKELVYFGTYSGELYKMTRSNKKCNQIMFNLNVYSTKKIKKFDHLYATNGPMLVIEDKTIKRQIPISHVRDFHIIEDSIYYVSSLKNGIFLPKENKLLPHQFTDSSQSEIGGRAVERTSENKHCYMALNTGLFFLENNVWHEVKHEGKSIFSGSMTQNGKSLLVASISEGLIVIANGKVTNIYNKKNSKIDNELKYIAYQKPYIWTNSNEKLFRINEQNGEIVSYDKKIGINTKDINQVFAIDSVVFLATNRGIIEFPIDLKWKNEYVPQIKLLHQHVIDPMNQIKLNSQNSGLKISVKTALFRSRQDFKILYKLNGIDSIWHSQKSNNLSIQYTQIPSGTYTLEVKILNEHGVESKTETLVIVVDPQIWERWWFYVLLALLLSGILSLIFYIREKSIKKKLIFEKKLITSQLVALKSQMNPHFMYNALNSIQALILQKDIKNSNLYLTKFSNLMRKILDSSGQDSISLKEEINLLELYLSLEHLRFGDEFTYSINTEEVSDTEQLSLPPMLLQPFVENALKHGLLHKKGTKSLKISFTENKNTLICQIQDNGVGRQSAAEINERRQKNNSFATQATQKRIDLLSSLSQTQYKIEIIDLFDTNKQAIGTKVLVYVPI